MRSQLILSSTHPIALPFVDSPRPDSLCNLDGNFIMKQILGYENEYAIDGELRIINLKTGKTKGIVFDSNSGYFKTQLWKDGKMKCFFYHRIVATSFIPNIEHKPCVNHKNGIKTDNRVENLEWVTYAENLRHSANILKKNRSQDRHNYKGALHTEYGIFVSAQEGAEMLGISKRGFLHRLNGDVKNKTPFIWSL